MDLNRQALLLMALAVLTPAVAGHALRPARLARTIREHRVLPAPTVAAALVVAGELAAIGVAALGWATGTPRLAGVVLAATGLGLAAYVAVLLRRGVHGDCGCSPLTTSITRLSLLPGLVVMAAGLVLSIGGNADDTALARAATGADKAAALLVAGLLGALVSLVPVSALVGNPRDFGDLSKARDLGGEA